MVVALLKEVAVGDDVAVGLEEISEVGEGVIGADSVAVGVGFDDGIISTILSIALVDMTRSRFVERISTWSG